MESFLEGKKEITVITVVYNGEAFLEPTIQSVASQTAQNIEFIIIDGGSTDGTIDIIRKYEKHIDFWISEPDNGVFDAMNKGIALATGKWLLFLNAGDKFPINDTLEQAQLERYPSISLVYGNRIQDSEILTYPMPVSSLKFGLIMACHQAMFFNKEVLKDELFYDITHPLFCEYDLVTRIVKHKYKIQYIDLAVVDFLSGGISSKISWEARKAKIYFLYKHYGLFGLLNLLLDRLKIIQSPTPQISSIEMEK